jgi:ligand-binding sensor domain-containing protein
LPESACFSVTVGQQGKILVKHPNRPLLSELDGYEVNVLPSPDTGPNRVYASPAGQLWAATTEGLREFRDGAWVIHAVPEIATEFRGGQAMRAVPLCPVRQGVVLFLLPDRLMEFNAEQPGSSRVSLLRTAAQTQLERFSGLSVARDGGLWIAGGRGLAKVQGPARNLKPDSEWREIIPPASLGLYNFQEPWEDANGGVTSLAESKADQRRQITYFDGQHWSVLPAGSEKVRRAWRGPDRTFWAATIDSLFQFDSGNGAMLENQEISARAYFDVAVEPNGAFWLATSDGLFRYSLLAWQSPSPTRQLNSLVHGFAEDAEGRLWFASGANLHVVETNVQSIASIRSRQLLKPAHNQPVCWR